MRRAMCWVCAVLIVCSGVLTADAQEKPGELVIRATGQGFPPAGKPARIGAMLAKRAAKVVALRNLLKTVSGMVPDAKGDTKWLEGHLKGWKVTKEEAIEKGGFRVTVEMPVASMAGALRVILVERARLQAENAELKKKLAAATAEANALRERLNDVAESLNKLLKKIR